jgi:hypothetical protein
LEVLMTLTAADFLQETCDRVDEYMRAAEKRINKRYGQGYAQEHSALLAGYLQAAVQLEIFYGEVARRRMTDDDA